MFDEQMQVIAHCWNCHRLMIFCPNCVTSIAVDPQTGLPPEVRRTEGGRRLRPPAGRSRRPRPLHPGTAV
ncbi:hypothetical protein [Nocardia sp. NPDC046763]|uniref:hypothetical protein n=1 Tax=Nocardia sp. NPDC046763 TaxID=3155256 RepID=UPI0033CA6EFB